MLKIKDFLENDSLHLIADVRLSLILVIKLDVHVKKVK